MTSIIDKLLINKPLGAWQESVVQEGRNCEKCGARALVTAPSSDIDSMVRISCPVCGHLSFEFPPEKETIINFADIRR